MKVLLLNPLADAEHYLLRVLRDRGFGVLVSSNPIEAYDILKLHQRTIELAIVHREDVQGNGDPGLHFIQLLKKDPTQSDLPYVITSGKWTAADFSTHQSTPEGANAYLSFPGDESKILEVLEKIFGGSLYPLARGAVTAPQASSSEPPPAFTEMNAQVSSLVLEDVSTFFELNEEKSTSGLIRLEMPDFDDEFPKKQGARDVLLEEIVLTDPPVLENAAETDLAGNFLATQILPSPFSEANPALLISMDASGEIPKPAELEGSLSSLPAELSLLQSILDAAPLEPLAQDEAPYLIPVESPAAPRNDEGAELDSDESLIAREMPYLFGAGSQGVPKSTPSSYDFILPVGDAVVPGGAAHSPDLETLKKYLLLREGDVAALSIQLKLAREQVGAVEEALQLERSRGAELERVIEDKKWRIEEFEKEKKLALEGLQVEIDELKFQSKAKADRVRVLDSHVREATDEMERLKDRVRADIRKIRVREKELENRLEIMKKDSEALIGARENKIIELKRKVDLLEFNMDLLQDQHAREKESSAKVKERLSRALQAVRVAGGLLDKESA